MSKKLIALGSNQHSVVGTPVDILQKAIKAMESRCGVILKVSRFYQTPCFPVGAGPDYVNAAVLMQSALPAEECLAHLHEIEAGFGRERVQRWGQRTLDLDLIAMEDHIAPDVQTYEKWRDLELELQKETAPSELILPHPRLQERAFVLGPMMDVAPNWVHPVSGLSVTQMYNALPEGEKAAVIALKA